MDSIYNSLVRIFGDNNVKKNWDVAKNAEDEYTRQLYVPRLDYAVGPFNITNEVDDNLRRINDVCNEYRGLIEILKNADNNNVYFDISYNENPRCFLAIELENKTTRKHRIGSMLNASAIGKIAIILAADEKVFNSLIKIREYLYYLHRVKKVNLILRNLLLLKKGDFINLLNEFNNRIEE